MGMSLLTKVCVRHINAHPHATTGEGVDQLIALYKQCLDIPPWTRAAHIRLSLPELDDVADELAEAWGRE